LGEINDAQQARGCRTIETLDGPRRVALALFPADRQPPTALQSSGVTVNPYGCWNP
jgi:hypothetical protein